MHPHYRYLDALRGVAILGVIAFHTSEHIPDNDGPLRTLTDFGRYGVQLFFLVSAMALLTSWHARRDGALAFYVRRLFRIAPMFWLAAVAYLIGQGLAPRPWAPDGVSALAVFLTFSLQHGWHPEAIGAIVPGGWSIAAEVAFYVLFPLLALIVTNLRRAAFAMMLATALGLVLATLVAPRLPATMPEYMRTGFVTLWFPTQLPVFLAGFALYFVQLRSGSGGLAVIHSRALEFIGRVSYSAYFWHFAVLALYDWSGAPHVASANITFVVLFLGSVAATSALSYASYNLVERPAIRLGSRLLTRGPRNLGADRVPALP